MKPSTAPGFIQADNTTGRQTFNNDLLGQKCPKAIASAPNAERSACDLDRDP